MCQHVSLPIFYGRSCSFQCVRNAASVADPVRVMVQPMAKQPPSSLAHASCCSEWLSTKDATTIVTEKTKIRVLISGGARLVFITVKANAEGTQHKRPTPKHIADPAAGKD